MKKRVFTAIEISEEAKLKTSKYIENLRKDFPKLRVGWEKPEKLHLTLKFLGEIENREVEKLRKAVETTSQKITNFRLQLAETGVFPKISKARVLWIDVKDESGKIIDLNSILEDECEKAGFARESRIFKPHLTIARLREPERASQLIEKHLQQKFEPVEFEVSEIVIFQSTLQPTGSVYNKIDSFQFADSK